METWGSHTGNWEHDSEFSQCVDNTEQHDSNNTEANHQSKRATGCESRSRTDEKSSSNGTTDGNHLHVSAFQLTVETRGIMRDVSRLGNWIFLGIDNLLTEIVEMDVVFSAMERVEDSRRN
jgi:hypothetical protein